MSTWRRKAIEFLPQFRNEIDKSARASYLWVEISEKFCQAVETEDLWFIEGTLKYLVWSFSDEAGLEAQQAVNCGFLEDIASNKKLWNCFSKWFSPAQFRQYKGSFQYALSAEDFSKLEAVFYENGQAYSERN